MAGYPSLSTYGGLLADPGYPGMIVDMNDFTSETKVNEAAAAIDYGVAVCRGLTGDDTCHLPTADNQEIIGISIRHNIGAYSNISSTGTPGSILYQQYDAVPVLYSGLIWITAAENVTRGDAALSLTAGAGGAGTISGTTSGAAGAGRVAIPRATWETTTAATALGVVRINR